MEFTIISNIFQIANLDSMNRYVDRVVCLPGFFGISYEEVVRVLFELLALATALVNDLQ